MSAQKRWMMAMALLVITAGNGMSQVIPGYQGKRLIVAYDFLNFPAFTNGGNNQEVGLSYFNITHTLRAEWVTGRKTSLGLQGRFGALGLDLGQNTFTYNAAIRDVAGNEIGFDSETLYRIPGGSYARLGFFSVGGNARFYLSQPVAPLGTFVQGNFEIMSYKVTPEGSDPFGDRSNISTSEFVNGGVHDLPQIPDQRYSAVALSYSVGRQRVIFDRMVWRYGMQSGMIFGGSGEGWLFSPDEFTNFPEEDEIVPNRGRNRITNYMLFNLFFGIGFLAY